MGLRQLQEQIGGFQLVLVALVQALANGQLQDDRLDAAKAQLAGLKAKVRSQLWSPPSEENNSTS